MLIGLQLFDGDAASNRRQRLAVEALVRQPDVQTVNLQFQEGEPCVAPELETIPLLARDADPGDARGDSPQADHARAVRRRWPIWPARAASITSPS